MKAFYLIVCAVALSIGSLQGQTLLTETTWGGVGSDVADGVASAADGSSYVVGITDSFTTDQFGNPSPKIFAVKFAPDGSLSWQRIWNGTTIRGLGRPDVAVSADGSVYVSGVTADNGGDAVLLKFDANGDFAVGAGLGRHSIRSGLCCGDSLRWFCLYRRHRDELRTQLGRLVRR
jgi:hypothetical protein